LPAALRRWRRLDRGDPRYRAQLGHGRGTARAGARNRRGEETEARVTTKALIKKVGRICLALPDAHETTVSGPAGGPPVTNWRVVCRPSGATPGGAYAVGRGRRSRTGRRSRWGRRSRGARAVRRWWGRQAEGPRVYRGPPWSGPLARRRTPSVLTRSRRPVGHP